MNQRELLLGGGAALSLLAIGCAGNRGTKSSIAGRGEPKEQSMYRPGTTLVTFIGGTSGAWRAERMSAVRGDALPPVERIAVHTEVVGGQEAGAWSLRGVAGHARYVERHEKGPLDTRSPPLGRAEATKAALIAIKKSPEWWALPQDERRAIFEGRSRHIADSMPYLPRIARRLHHSRDLGEPFDFLTWFEFAPENAAAFDDLLGILRSREEWTFVDREVDIRLDRS